MKTTLSILALSVAGVMVGCNADGTMKTAWNDDGMQNTAQAGVNDMNRVGTAKPDDVQLRAGNDKTTPSVALTNEDRAFVKDAAAAGLYEVQAGQKALLKSTNAGVKTLAQHMVDDHTKANTELMSLAQRKGVDVGTLSADQIAMLAKLDSLSGTEFDREYVSQQRTAHDMTISKFQWAASNSSDRDIRDWSAGKIPALREHLAQINNSSNTNIGSDK